jgi:ketosteroid isomerase-like protein
MHLISAAQGSGKISACIARASAGKSLSCYLRKQRRAFRGTNDMEKIIARSSPAKISSHRRRRALAAAGMLVLAVSLWGSGAAAQKKNKKDKQAAQPADVQAPLPDPKAIDLLISQMLGAWQIGDVDMMHKYYADDLTSVSGEFEPPLLGWDNYVKAYQAQRARTQGVRMDRVNTYTKVMGDTAWSTYQWQFSGLVDGKAASALGHTTLALEKRNGAWLIVMNHTSEVSTSSPATPAGGTPTASKPTTMPASPATLKGP